jgi:hypothetical protein
MTRWLVALSVCALCAMPRPSRADERHAVLVFGAAGGEKYEQQYANWEKRFVAILQERFAFPPEAIVTLSPASADPGRVSSRDNVRRVFVDLRRTARPDDVTFVVLIGHGNIDTDGARFNLVGPDIDVAEWSTLAGGLPGRLVFVNAAGASFPFLEQLSGPRRIVITATDSGAQRFDTVFPGLMLDALEDPATDVDRNGRVSLWELFTQTSQGVKRYYEQRGQLATERALVDDNSDGRGQEAGAPGQDGALARSTYLDPNPAANSDDPALTALLTRQQRLEEDVEALKLRKSSMPPDEWGAEFERLMIELARVSKAIRSGS